MTFCLNEESLKRSKSRFPHLKKLSLNFSSSSFIIPVNLIHPNPIITQSSSPTKDEDCVTSPKFEAKPLRVPLWFVIISSVAFFLSYLNSNYVFFHISFN